MRNSTKIIGLAASAAAAALGLSGCGGQATSSAEPVPPAQVAPAGPDGISQVKLSQEAAGRIGLQTDTVHEQDVDGSPRKVIPYAAVLYDPTGETYAYSNPAPLVFARIKLNVDTVKGDVAVLTDGPPDGTKVVTLGATELFGAEFEVGGE
jgi:hypothetical protein